MGNCSISLVMNGIHKCSGGCLYCSAAKSMDYRGNDNKNTFVFYKDKTHDRIIEYCKSQLDIDKRNNENTTLHVDIWGGNPLENFEQFKEVVSFLKNEMLEFGGVNLSTSGNGLELQDNDLVQYLIDNDINYQLSHDGVGQWLRTGLIDPLYWEKTRDNIAKLAKNKILNSINCTLNIRNPSFFENIEYFNNWRKEIGIFDEYIYIKLNHVADGTVPIDKVWQFDDRKYIKKGETIGDLSFKGKVLHEYLHEFRKLALILCDPDAQNNSIFKCYAPYILEQMSRFKIIDQNNPESMGGCVAFQRGLRDFNFAIDTKGEYTQCNLIDSDNFVLNKTAKQADYCKECKYKNTLECNPCGSENFAAECEYKYYWAETLEEMFQVLELKNKYSYLFNNDSKCDCRCSCEKEEPVFCVKNYKI